MNFKLEILANFEFLGVSSSSTNCSYNYQISLAFSVSFGSVKTVNLEEGISGSVFSFSRHYGHVISASMAY